MTHHKIIIGDCLQGMKLLDDESVDLVLTDPPYGQDTGNMALGQGAMVMSGKRLAESVGYEKSDWDKEPLSAEQFLEIHRTSRNQIIFGGNYFSDILPVSRGWMVWDKKKGNSDHYADCELIWSSFDTVSRIFHHRWRGCIRDSEKTRQRFHPTQKPEKLIEWLLRMFSREGDTILDPFAGSFTTSKVAKDLNRNSISIEINPDYWQNIGKKRLRYNQPSLDNSVSFEVIEL